jgi:alkanesulfonate monooxygenase SsuD/methylene tetrahydromethanopterin reductase-like flavin-dependent oxidoreductase (luciferase family)
VTDFGLQSLPSDLGLADGIERYRTVLELLPESFSTVWVSDHLQFGTRPVAEAWTLLTYLAATFPRFRFGHMVLSQSFRNPALLAKMAATLQELTHGRFILGLGAGWHEEEYRAYGFEYPTGGVRVDQLAEAIEVIRALWTQAPATFQGVHYRIDNAYSEPRPDPQIPILIGTNGPKALGVAARLADWWNWDGPWEETYRTPQDILREHCERIGRPFGEITLTSSVYVWITDDLPSFQPTYDHSFYPGQIFHVLGPTPADVAREIQLLVDHGVAQIQISFEDMLTVRRFIDEVIPSVRLGPMGQRGDLPTS